MKIALQARFIFIPIRSIGFTEESPTRHTGFCIVQTIESDEEYPLFNSIRPLLLLLLLSAYSFDTYIRNSLGVILRGLLNFGPYSCNTATTSM